MMTRADLLALSIAVAAAAVSAQQAQAQGRPCGPRDAVVEGLARTYGETRRSAGIAANNGLLEVFASDETGTWTITVTTPGGPTCLVASGESYQSMADALPKPGDDA
jgi:hypothetical protein